jgi:YacP-like NYN domain
LQLCRSTDHVETWSPPYVLRIVASIRPMTILVDARNVLRSRWPNVPENELVERIQDWAGERGERAIVVFDGRAPGGLRGEHDHAPNVTLVGTGGEEADDWIVRRAAELAAAGEPYVLVSSDRAVRAAAGPAAENTIGGGGFLTELGLR